MSNIKMYVIEKVSPSKLKEEGFDVFEVGKGYIAVIGKYFSAVLRKDLLCRIRITSDTINDSFYASATPGGRRTIVIIQDGFLWKGSYGKLEIKGASLETLLELGKPYDKRRLIDETTPYGAVDKWEALEILFIFLLFYQLGIPVAEHKLLGMIDNYYVFLRIADAPRLSEYEILYHLAEPEIFERVIEKVGKICLDQWINALRNGYGIFANTICYDDLNLSLQLVDLDNICSLSPNLVSITKGMVPKRTLRYIQYIRIRIDGKVSDISKIFYSALEETIEAMGDDKNYLEKEFGWMLEIAHRKFSGSVVLSESSLYPHLHEFHMIHTI